MLHKGLLKEHASIFNFAQYIADWVAIAFSSWVAFYFYPPESALIEHYILATGIAILLSVFIFSRFFLYQAWRGLSVLDEIKLVSLSWLVVVVALMALAFITKVGASYSRGWFLLWVSFGYSLLVLFRFILRRLLRWMRKSGFNQRHIVLVGNVELANKVYGRLNLSPSMGFVIKGYFSDSSDKGLKLEDNFIYLGALNELKKYLSENNVDQIWLTMSLRDEEVIHEILYELRHSTVDIRFIPDLFGLKLLNHSIMEIAGLPVLNLSVTPMIGLNKLLKEIEDKLISFLILIMISPLMLLVSVAVKISSPGPIFYRQERIGWNGKAFNILKFRSMPVNNEEQGVKWGAKDKLTTKLGSFLRRTSLDELPQFINVLKGDMSIVGPRPERTVFVEKLKNEIPGYMKKHLVKAGITGWAQVNGWRGDTDLTKRIEYDLYYIENWSLWLDMQIMIITIFKGIMNKNAY